MNRLGFLGFLGALGCLGFLSYLPGYESAARLYVLFGLSILFLLFAVPVRQE